MVILGLGSNLNHPLLQLRRALAVLRAHAHIQVEQVSPVYCSDALLASDDAPSAWQQPFLNVALRCSTTLAPLALLREIKKIEAELGRDVAPARWSPRIIDIDILTMDDIELHSVELTLPHPHLYQRPFALWPLTDVAPLWNLARIRPILAEWGSRLSGQAPLHTQQIMQRIDAPQIVGILNITPNSFSDGGRFQHVEIAVKQAEHLVASGAEIIDIGAEATSPNAQPLSHEEEWKRLYPVLSGVRTLQQKPYATIHPRISVDTYHPETAEKAIELGVDWINDVSGLTNSKMREVIACAKHVTCVMMHQMSLPATPHHLMPEEKDPADEIYLWGQQQLAILHASGIDAARILFDPGIGFGKSSEQSLYLVQHNQRLRRLGMRLLYGHSRKRFLGLFTEKKAAERDLETTLIALYLAQCGVDFVRVHDVESCARALKVKCAMLGGSRN